MKLTKEQQKVVEDNMGLVNKVIRDRVHGVSQAGAFSYDDLFQIGCIGLIKAATTDGGGCFSTYAYRLIWNEICNALVKSTKLEKHEIVFEPEELSYLARQDIQEMMEGITLKQLVAQLEENAPKGARRGIRCLMLAEDGYSTREIGRILGADAGKIRMWMTRARRYLRSQPALGAYVRRGKAL